LTGEGSTPTDRAAAYAAHCRELTRRLLVPALATMTVATLTYAAADLLIEGITRGDFRYYGALILLLAGAWGRLRFGATPEPARFLLVIDILLSLIISSRLISGEATLSGTALVLSLKMLALPLIIHWTARQQLGAVIVAIISYAGFAAVHSTWSHAEIIVHQVIGLPIAGFLSWIGASMLDRARKVAFDRNLAMQQSEERLRTLLTEREADALVAQATSRVGNLILGGVNKPGLVVRLAAESAQVLGADFAHVLLYERATDTYSLADGWGDPPEMWEEIRCMRFPRSAMPELHRRLDAEGLIQTSPSFAEPLIPADLQAPYGITMSMIVQLRADDEILGLVSIGFRGREQPFSELQQRIFRGIGQLASLGLANARLFEELQQASRIKADFVASMSHELRTPLNVIVGYHELLLDGEFGSLHEPQRDTVERLQRHSRQLLELISATLDLSRLDSQHPDIARDSVKLSNMIEVLRRETYDANRHQAIAITYDVAADADEIVTDATKLRIILRNLLTNAAKFAAETTIEIAANATRGGVEIAVRDGGIGIPLEAQESIFEPFTQADPSIGTRYGGVGLGLHIVRRLVDVLGGTISVESAPAQGATFRVWLPSSTSASHLYRAA